MAPKRPNGAGAFPIAVETPAPNPPDPTALYAALDLGTNSCRMLIAQPKGSQFHVLDSFSKSVQLGARLRELWEIVTCVDEPYCQRDAYLPPKAGTPRRDQYAFGGNRGLPSCA